MKYIFIFFTILLFCCTSPNKQILVQNTGETQGTFYHIQYMSENGECYQTKIDSLLLEIDSSVSIYKSFSIISKLNNGEQLETDDIFNSVYFDAVRVWRNTNGYFDCSVSPLVSHWGFYKEYGYHNLNIDSSEIFDILRKIGMDKTTNNGNNIFLEDGVSLDFNAIAQGYSVDLISKLLEGYGIKNYLIEVGGEIRCKGVNADDNVWTVGVDKPNEEIDLNDRFQFIVRLQNKSLATSGNYRKFYVNDGVKYSHTINPKTGFPSRNRLLSVTVVTSECSLADAYATGFMAMGVERTKKLLDSIEDQLDVYLIYTDKHGNWETYITEGMQDIIIN